MAEFDGRGSNRLCLDAKQAGLIRRLAHATDDRVLLEKIINAECPATAAYARSCYHDPYDTHMWRVTMTMHAIDKTLGTFGIEGLGKMRCDLGAPLFEYCNAGDEYATTLIYTRKTDTIRIGCWGDIVETHDKKREW